MKGKILTCAVLSCLTMLAGGWSARAAYDENLNVYTLDAVVVDAEKTKNKFGDTITEQSYYRTGGDVKVITREEIDKRHYNDLTEAVKRIPGITFQNPGYRGGEYGYQMYNNGVAINGDTRVIILVDGRRVDNVASTRISSTSTKGSKSTGVNLDEVTNMANVEKIEVIKGPGASKYGADATGGVINIITRKGGAKNVGTLDLATGSWDKHTYSITYSGSAGNDKSWKYFISANRNRSGNTQFIDGTVDKKATLPISKYKEDGVNFRVDKEIDDQHDLRIWYNHKNGYDGYPVSTPSLRYWNEKDWYRILFEIVAGRYDSNNKLTEKGKWWTDSKQPGYHNCYLVRALNDVKTEFNVNDLDISYTFKKVNGMDSFVRFYNQQHTYRTRSFMRWGKLNGKYITGAGSLYDAYNEDYPNGATDAQLYAWMKEHLPPFPGGSDKEAIKKWQKETTGGTSPVTDWHQEKNHGFEVEYADTIGKNDIITNVNYDMASNSAHVTNQKTGKIVRSSVTRNTWRAFAQDKIHITDKWDLTPSIRYSRYSSVEGANAKKSQGKGNTDAFTYALNTEYLFNDSTSMYLGWSKIFRPLRVGDYSATTGIYKTPLKDEKGYVWTAGIKKNISDKTEIAVHYDWTKMTSAVATLPIWDTDLDDFASTALNAKETKKSFNITLDHQFNKHLTLSASYSHMKDKWEAKDGWVLDPDWGYANLGDINTAINVLTPKNHYALNLSYENGKLYTGLLVNWYTGNNRLAFSDNRFLVMDWNINYAIRPDLTLYAVVNNLTDEAYETSYNPRNGIASCAMPSRNFLFGVKYTF